MVLRALGFAVFLGAASAAPAAERPLLIAHSGASGYLPEHTLEAYALAVQQGADYIEPDLIITKDGVLISRHENDLALTTDVATKFPARKTTKTIGGRQVTGWFAEDFTLAEIKTLRMNERMAFRSHANDGKFLLPTFDEILALRARLSQESGRPIGIYPETKFPSYFASIGLPLEERLVEALSKAGLNHAAAPVFLQSFEASSLKKLRALSSLPRIQLLGAEPPTDDALKEIATYAQGIGPAKRMLIPVDGDGNIGPPTDVVARAHKLGLKIHPWTVKPEAAFLPKAYGGNVAAEYCQLAGLGIDGLFTDTPDLALKAWTESCPMSPAAR